MKTEDLALAIIKEQSQIVGDTLARSLAQNSGVIKFNSNEINDISLLENEHEIVIQKLVDSYSLMFGQASVEVCMNVVKRYTQLNPAI